MTQQPPVFVVAPARSGTTYLSHMLAGRLDLACSPETNALGILHRFTRKDRNATFGKFEREQLGQLMHGANRPYCALAPAGLREERIVDHPRAFAEWIVSLDRYSEGASVLEQTPRNGEHLRTLRWLFPEAVILFLLRNPFDVVQSNRATPWGTSNVFILFGIWARQYVELARLMRTYGGRRVMTVRYERLGRDSYRDAMIARLVRFGIGRRSREISIEPRNFDPAAWAGSHMSQSVGQFSTRSTGKWTERHPALRRLGEAFVVDALRRARGRRLRSWRMRVLEMADGFARSRIRR